MILHINLMDPSNLQQQEAIGILGVNLLYAVFHERASAEEFLKGLGELVAPHRLQIDYIGLRGPLFENDASGEWDVRALHARLVALRYAEAVIFTKNERFSPLVEALHKRAVVLAPGIFEWPSPYHAQMMETALQELGHEQGGPEDSRWALFVTVPPALPEQPNPDFSALMQKTEALQGLGYGVLLVHEREIYQISTTIQRFTVLPIRFVVGISVLLRVFEDDTGTWMAAR